VQARRVVCVHGTETEKDTSQIDRNFGTIKRGRGSSPKKQLKYSREPWKKISENNAKGGGGSLFVFWGNLLEERPLRPGEQETSWRKKAWGEKNPVLTLKVLRCKERAKEEGQPPAGEKKGKRVKSLDDHGTGLPLKKKRRDCRKQRRVIVKNQGERLCGMKKRGS